MGPTWGTSHVSGRFILDRGPPRLAPKGINMWLILFRTIVVLALGWAGWHYDPISGRPLVGLALGVLFALAIIGLELKLRRVSAHDMVGALVGGVTGLVGASLVLGVIDRLDLAAENFVHMLLIVFLVYIGVVIGPTTGTGSSRRASSPPSRMPPGCTSTRSSTPR
jgi:hypothetical protein